MSGSSYTAQHWMGLALEQAQQAYRQDEVPVGAVLVYRNACVVSAFNQMHSLGDPTKHAEMQIIAQSALLCPEGDWLRNGHLYVTLEPCAMCAHALRLAHIPVIYFGAYDVRGGAVEHGPRLLEDEHFFKPQTYGGILEQECQELLKNFFQRIRSHKAFPSPLAIET